MKHFSIFLTAFCVTLLAAAAIAQTTEPPATSSASRRQSGTVGPPVDAASTLPPAPSVRPSAPTIASPPAPAPEAEPAMPTVTEPAGTAKPAPPAAGSRASRRAAGRVTEADGSVALPTRPDRN